MADYVSAKVLSNGAKSLMKRPFRRAFLFFCATPDLLPVLPHTGTALPKQFPEFSGKRLKSRDSCRCTPV